MPSRALRIEFETCVNSAWQRPPHPGEGSAWVSLSVSGGRLQMGSPTASSILGPETVTFFNDFQGFSKNITRNGQQKPAHLSNENTRNQQAVLQNQQKCVKPPTRNYVGESTRKNRSPTLPRDNFTPTYKLFKLCFWCKIVVFYWKTAKQGAPSTP